MFCTGKVGLVWLISIFIFICSSFDKSAASELQQLIREKSSSTAGMTANDPSLETPSVKKIPPSRKDERRGKSSAKKTATEDNNGATLGEKMRKHLAGGAVTEKPSGKMNARIAVSLQALEEMKGKVRNPRGFRYSVSSIGTPDMITADDLTDAVPSIEKKTTAKSTADDHDHRPREFLRNNREALRLVDPDAELAHGKTTTDELGITRYRYHQQYRGITVWGREVSVYENSSKAITLFRGNYLPTSQIEEISPIITSADAIMKVVTSLGLQTQTLIRQEAMLVIWHDEQSRTDYLAWHVEVAADSDIYWHYFVDAKDGSIRNRYSGIMQGSAVPSSGVDLKGVTRNFTSWQQSTGLYYMIDVTRPINDGAITSVQYKGDIWVKNLQTGSMSSSTSATSGWSPAAVSLISNIYTVLDYFKNTHGLTGYSSTQQNIQANVNGSATSSGFPNNAFFNGADFSINFGLGDGTNYTNLASGLDVVAHEFAHGVVTSTANLTYQYQSGAMNESFADFFAAMVDRDDWIIGEDIYLKNGGVMRDMRNPHNSSDWQPAMMSEYINTASDNGGVHKNSGIPNRAVWLVAEGLTLEGSGISIGKVKTEKIWYRALTTYMHSNDRFLEARKAFIQAALDLYGDSAETAAVRAAWDAVGVFDAMTGQASTNSPTATDPLPGTDFLVTVYSGSIYLESASGWVGPLNTVSARNARPALVVGATESYIFYIDSINYDLRAISLLSEVDFVFDDSQYYWSLAIPQSAGKIAYTTRAIEPYIYIADYQSLTEIPYLLAFLTDNGTSVGSIEYADVMSFDFTGQKLVFDAKSIVSTPGLPDYTNWTIGILDLEAGSITPPLPPQPQGVDIGNPVFASNNNYVIAFDYNDTTSNENAIISYNLTASNSDGLALIAYSGSTDPFYIWQPHFNGSDNAIIFKYMPLFGNSSIRSIPVVKIESSWGGNQNAMSLFSSSLGSYPTLFRNSERIINARLAVSPTSIDFGTVIARSTAKKSFTIQNTGNIDLNLKEMLLTGSGFTHTGTLGLLPRNSSMTVEVLFQASSTSGTKSGTLKIVSNAGAPYDNITVQFNAIVPEPVNGSCGASSGQSFTTAPATGLCSPDVTATLTTTANGWSWSCPGSNGGNPASCSATLTTGGSCGPRHWTMPSASPTIMNLYGNLSINGRPAGNCDEIAAYDTTGTVIGVYYVDSSGTYGDMVINGDSTLTSGVDEGATVGEKLSIRVWDGQTMTEYAAPKAIPRTPTQSIPPYVKYQGPLVFATDAWVLMDVEVEEGISYALKTGWSMIGWTTGQGYYEGTSLPQTSDYITGKTLTSMGSKKISEIFGVLGFAGADYLVTVGPAGAVYIPGFMGNTLKNLLPGRGYWIYLPADKTITVPGRPLASAEPLPLGVGWNQVGYWGTDDVAPATGFTCIAGTYDVIVNETGQVYIPGFIGSTLKKLQKNRGYFIHNTTPTTLKFSCP